jgi:hypothetical protein
MVSINVFLSSDVVDSSACSLIILCPSLSSFESDILVESPSVSSSCCSSLGVAPSDTPSTSVSSLPSAPSKPADASFWSSPLPPQDTGELFVDESSVLPDFSGAGVICARASL